MAERAWFVCVNRTSLSVLLAEKALQQQASPEEPQDLQRLLADKSPQGP